MFEWLIKRDREKVFQKYFKLLKFVIVKIERKLKFYQNIMWLCRHAKRKHGPDPNNNHSTTTSTLPQYVWDSHTYVSVLHLCNVFVILKFSSKQSNRSSSAQNGSDFISFIWWILHFTFFFFFWETCENHFTHLLVKQVRLCLFFFFIKCIYVTLTKFKLNVLWPSQSTKCIYVTLTKFKFNFIMIVSINLSLILFYYILIE